MFYNPPLTKKKITRRTRNGVLDLNVITVWFCLGTRLDQITPLYQRFSVEHLIVIKKKKEILMGDSKKSDVQPYNLQRSNYGRRSNKKFM